MNINNTNLPKIPSVNNNVNSMVDKMKEIAKDSPETTSVNNKTNEVEGFSNLLTNALNSVNEAQMESSQLQEAYVKGDENVSLGQVVLATKKSGVAFQGLVSVRNKVVSAYKDIMNMQV